MATGKWRTGEFVWRELMTSDPEKAKGFYGELFNWSFKDSPMGEGRTYCVVTAPSGKQIGGILPLMGAGMPAWVGYLSIPDVDEAVAYAKSTGGTLGFGPMNIPNVGRCAYLSDPAGAWFTAFRDSSGDALATGEPPKTGEFCWETLSTNDIPKARDWYAKLTGWTSTKPVATLEMEIVSAGETMLADIEPCAPGVPPHWLSHVAVENLAVSVAKATKMGAKVLVASAPAGEWGTMGIIQDPTGAAISMFEAKQR